MTRNDTVLESPVGEDEPNHPRAVFNTKKLLNAAGFHGFRPGIEQMGEASPRFLADLERFQAAHDLQVDRTVQPGGPTLHMLTKGAFGMEEGPPSFAEAELFEHRFGRDPNATLSGEPIFGEDRSGSLDGEPDDLEQPPDAVPIGFEPPDFGDRPAADDGLPQLASATTAAIINKQLREVRDAPTLTQLAAFDILLHNINPLSPLRPSVGKLHEADAIIKDVNKRGVAHLTHEQKILALKRIWANAARGPAEEAARDKLLLALPPSQAFLADRDRRARAFAKTLWSDTEVKSAIGNWSRLSDADRLKALQTAINLHAKAYGVPGYKIRDAKLSSDTLGEFDQNTQDLRIDLAKLRRRTIGWKDIMLVTLHEGYHRNAYALARKFIRNQLEKSDPRYRRAQIYALQALLYVSSKGSNDPLHKVYQAQPSEVDANAFARIVIEARGATSGPVPLHR